MMYVSRVDVQESVLITPRRSATRCVPFVIWINSYRTNTNYRCSFITDSVSEDTRHLPVNYQIIAHFCSIAYTRT